MIFVSPQQPYSARTFHWFSGRLILESETMHGCSIHTSSRIRTNFIHVKVQLVNIEIQQLIGSNTAKLIQSKIKQRLAPKAELNQADSAIERKQI